MKKIISIILFVACLVVMVLTPIFAIPILKNNRFLTNETTYKGVINLWHIDTFEGGFGSRLNFLNNRAIEFEKQHKNTYIMVKNISEEQLIQNIENGVFPDMLSFGGKVSKHIKKYITAYTGSVSIREDILNSGVSGSEIWAVPWCMTGYTLIGLNKFLKNDLSRETILNNVYDYTTSIVFNKKKNNLLSVVYGENGFQLPLFALYKNNKKVGVNYNYSVNTDVKTQITAYQDFVSEGKASILLGTGRDIFRCREKLKNNKLGDITILPLGEYTDLIQYFSVFNNEDKEKLVMINKFIEFMTSDFVQRKLVNIGMFNVLGESYYTDETLKEMEDKLNGDLSTINVFNTEENMKKYSEIVFDCIFNGKDEKELQNIT